MIDKEFWWELEPGDRDPHKYHREALTDARSGAPVWATHGYSDSFITFDIETSTFAHQDEGGVEWAQTVYAAQFAWGATEKECAVVRTVSEALAVLANFAERAACSLSPSLDPPDAKHLSRRSPKRWLICYVHNLEYESSVLWSTIKEEATLVKTIGNDLVGLLWRNILFKDSCRLAGGVSLSTFIDQYAQFNSAGARVARKGEDFDYSITRYSHTPLTDAEMGYCVNDVVGLWQAIDGWRECYSEFAGERISLRDIPWTSMGIGRGSLREIFYGVGRFAKKHTKFTPPADVTDRRKRKREIQATYRMMTELHDRSEEMVKQEWRAFTGGVAGVAQEHYRAWYEGEDIGGYDARSMHPSMLLLNKYPLKRIGGPDKPTAKPKPYAEGTGGLADYTFTNVRYKRPEVNIPPFVFDANSSKRSYENATWLSDRIETADTLVATFTNVEYDLFCEYYDFDYVIEKGRVTYEMGYLPNDFARFIIKCYELKTLHKGTALGEGAKVMLNGIYGIIATNPIQDEYDFDFYEWTLPPHEGTFDPDKVEPWYYLWAPFCLAYARRHLARVQEVFGHDAIKVDTDSCKGLHYNSHRPAIEAINREIEEQCAFVERERGWEAGALSPKGKTIGIWEDDGHYAGMLALGSKQYIYLYDPEKKWDDLSDRDKTFSIVARDGRIYGGRWGGVKVKNVLEWANGQGDLVEEVIKGVALSASESGNLLKRVKRRGVDKTITVDGHEVVIQGSAYFLHPRDYVEKGYDHRLIEQPLVANGEGVVPERVDDSHPLVDTLDLLLRRMKRSKGSNTRAAREAVVELARELEIPDLEGVRKMTPTAFQTLRATVTWVADNRSEWGIEVATRVARGIGPLDPLM